MKRSMKLKQAYFLRSIQREKLKTPRIARRNHVLPDYRNKLAIITYLQRHELTSYHLQVPTYRRPID